MTDNLTALEARDNWLWVAHQWAALTQRLQPTSNGALTGVVVQTSDKPSPIDVHVSDLMHEIAETTRFYAVILLGETDWQPTTSQMPALLTEVATRYGHFVTGDDDAMALGFTYDAHDYRERVRKTLERPPPPTYMGPCQTTNCEGELYLRTDNDYARCPECGTTTTRLDQRMWLDGELAGRLMEPTELVPALKTLLDRDIPIKTIRSWIRRGHLTADKDTGLYPLDQAKELASRPTRQIAS